MRTARFGMMLVLGLGLTVWHLPKVSAQGKSDQVTFETADSVKIVGSYYPSNKGIKAPCVLLLHDFDKQKGGHSQTQEWIDLASDLQTAGYAVLSFDFRGFGQSTTVGPGFWMPPNGHNSVLMRAGAKPPMNINAKNFPAAYFRHLVNDVAAAKAYLDNENDGSQAELAQPGRHRRRPGRRGRHDVDGFGIQAPQGHCGSWPAGARAAENGQ